MAAGTSAPLIGEYRYAMLGNAFRLQSGTQYVLAAQTDPTDGYRYATVPPATISADPRITIGAQAGVYNYGPAWCGPPQPRLNRGPARNDIGLRRGGR